MIRAAGPTDLGLVRSLLVEYSVSLGVSLWFQNFEEELQTLEKFYEVILLSDEEGCVALRRIDETTCEMKRLYVRPHARGKNVGRRLAEAIIEEGKRRGYARMRLDTLPTMEAAMKLYESLGFKDIPQYRPNPIEGSRFLELPLHRA